MPTITRIVLRSTILYRGVPMFTKLPTSWYLAEISPVNGAYIPVP